MNVSLYQSAAAMNAAALWQETVANNLASNEATGYKKQEVSFASVVAGALHTANRPGNPSTQGVLPAAKLTTNFQSGEMKHTGVSTHVALNGEGFFEVQLPDGSTALTRNGEFIVNTQGQLATKDGLPVLGDTGPIQMDAASRLPITILSNGEVSQGNDQRGKIRTVEVNDPRLLTPLGGTCFLPRHPDLVVQPARKTTINQGYVESANTVNMLEMAHLMTAMRSFEAGQRLALTQDDRMAKAINALGNVN